MRVSDLTGINSIMYYGIKVLKEAGFSESAALIANIAPGTIAVLGSILSFASDGACGTAPRHGHYRL